MMYNPHIDHEYAAHVAQMHTWTGDSSVASPICQEGQSERNFPIFAFSS